MNRTNLDETLDHNRWLLNNGLISDITKRNIFLYGSIVHKDIKAVDVDIDATSRSILYRLYIDKKLIKKINKFNVLKTDKSFFGLWRLKRLLKKEGNLDIGFLLKMFIKDYCGPKWNTEFTLLPIEEYKEEKDV